MKGFDYTQRLSKLRMTSIQRRHERYKILYAYKIKEGLVPNISETNGLKFTNHIRLGCKCSIKTYPLSGPNVVRARDDSFALTACRLWNSLPKSIRDIGGKDVQHFKRKLDRVLHYYPDVPRCGTSSHLYTEIGRKTNSLCDHYKDIRTREAVDRLRV